MRRRMDAGRRPRLLSTAMCLRRLRAALQVLLSSVTLPWLHSAISHVHVRNATVHNPVRHRL